MVKPTATQCYYYQAFKRHDGWYFYMPPVDGPPEHAEHMGPILVGPYASEQATREVIEGDRNHG